MAQYLVQPGDYPIRIAQMFGISFEAFSAMNPGLCVGTQCRVLHVGDVVNVPDAAGEAEIEVPITQSESAVSTPPWMVVAQGEVGVAEWNPGNNPRILQYLASVGLNAPDETSWCGAFVNWCLQVSGFPSAGTAHAASWAGFGRAVQPTYGAITVLQPLAQGASGHVGFLHAIVGDQVWLLSGNSSNAVRISAYPLSKLIAHGALRWPV
jgi:uncharacterized protein (TIGR02594 family)